MEVKLFANLVDLTDERTVTIDAATASTVSEVLDELFRIAPPLETEVVEEDGRPCEHINILVNGTNVDDTDEGLALDVEADDEIAIFPPVSGG